MPALAWLDAEPFVVASAEYLAESRAEEHAMAVNRRHRRHQKHFASREEALQQEETERQERLARYRAEAAQKHLPRCDDVQLATCDWPCTLRRNLENDREGIGFDEHQDENTRGFEEDDDEEEANPIERVVARAERWSAIEEDLQRAVDHALTSRADEPLVFIAKELLLARGVSSLPPTPQIAAPEAAVPTDSFHAPIGDVTSPFVAEDLEEVDEEERRSPLRRTGSTAGSPPLSKAMSAMALAAAMAEAPTACAEAATAWSSLAMALASAHSTAADLLQSLQVPPDRPPELPTELRLPSDRHLIVIGHLPSQPRLRASQKRSARVRPTARAPQSARQRQAPRGWLSSRRRC